MPNARVWRTYEDDSTIYDTNMVEECRDNIDVLLIFVSLRLKLSLLAFVNENLSAAITTFVVQICQDLRRHVSVFAFQTGPRSGCHRQRFFGQRHSPFPTESQHRLRLRHHRCLSEQSLVYRPVSKPDNCIRRRSREAMVSS
ncbi:uncharacterized protein EV420DRAFT_589223 [Desarmillaria tabescens]|uniref:DUF6535 domain-containing protein n=1 Tax=Armillaria tabescens TaxID=1929756 RepID=A0AA39K617_ARMTA|nr:uncharacterized protein EV420DRAFT_589223 [Desarmillaria tabescens]KAK0455226.1 hypothetical protein EV420DRAFT_589223 [Desarmillaria tabescens]